MVPGKNVMKLNTQRDKKISVCKYNVLVLCKSPYTVLFTNTVLFTHTQRQDIPTFFVDIIFIEMPAKQH